MVLTGFGIKSSGFEKKEDEGIFGDYEKRRKQEERKQLIINKTKSLSKDLKKGITKSITYINQNVPKKKTIPKRLSTGGSFKL